MIFFCAFVHKVHFYKLILGRSYLLSDDKICTYEVVKCCKCEIKVSKKHLPDYLILIVNLKLVVFRLRSTLGSLISLQLLSCLVLHQAVFRNLSVIYQSFIKLLSGICRTVFKPLPGSCQAVVRQLSGPFQAILSKCQLVIK